MSVKHSVGGAYGHNGHACICSFEVTHLWLELKALLGCHWARLKQLWVNLLGVVDYFFLFRSHTCMVLLPSITVAPGCTEGASTHCSFPCFTLSHWIDYVYLLSCFVRLCRTWKAVKLQHRMALDWEAGQAAAHDALHPKQCQAGC